MFSTRIYSFIAALLLFNLSANAQDRPIGYWRSHLPYNTAVGLATDGSTIFAAATQAFFTYSSANNSMEPYSKVEGMSDIGMQCIGYDRLTNTAVLVYSDGNIDLFKDNTFYNIPDLKVKTISGDKTVNQVYTENGIAYLSSSIGILVIDLKSHNITETYQFINNNQLVPVSCFGKANGYYYAATTAGLYRADTSNPELQNFQVWQIIDSTRSLLQIATVNNRLFASNSKSVYALINDTFQLAYTPKFALEHIDAGNGSLLISEFSPTTYQGRVKMMSLADSITDSFICGDPVQAIQLGDNSYWVADSYYGLMKRDGNQADKYAPPGPTDAYCFDIYANNKNVWVAHGGYDDLFRNLGNRDCLSNLVDDKWVSYQAYTYQPFDTLTDFVSVVKDEVSGTVYMSSFLSGLFILKSDGSYELVKQGSNSVFDSSAAYFGDGQRMVIGTALDNERNLWVTTLYARHQLYARAVADGTWYKFLVPGPENGGETIVDDNDQIWYVNDNGAGVTVYNYNQTLSNASDDMSYHLSTGVGYGNLPSNNVFCIAKDLNNSIWIGTDNGIGIVSNCAAPFAQTPPCDANLPIVQYDQFAGYLFAGNVVKTIAVDGGNRKWVGTDNGVWLLSPDAQTIIYRFTVDNSPLPSNTVRKIAIDKVTGDVYIGTDAGLISYRSTATEGGTANQDVKIFPNPVKSGYEGTIAINGLVANADVRITDINGQLVYKTTAFGGQAVWNGLDYTGHRPQTGVYLVFISSSDGSQTYAGKIVFVQ